MSRRGGRGQGLPSGRGQTSLPHRPGDQDQRPGRSNDFSDQPFRSRGRGDFRGGRGGGRGGRGGSASEVQVYQPASGPPVVDTAVLGIEDETQASTVATSRPGSASQQTAQSGSGHPLRPGYGTRGRAVTLWANYFHLLLNDELVLKRYEISVTAVKTSRPPTGKKLKRVIELLLEEHLADHKLDVVTDFKSNLLSKVDLKDGAEYSIVYRLEEDDEPSPDVSYRVKLGLTGTVSVSELIEYLTSTQAGGLLTNKEEILQALNIVTGHQPKADSTIASVGANKHFQLGQSAGRFELGAGLIALRGFFVSVRAATARLLVNVQVKHGAFYREGPLDKLMTAFIASHGPGRFNLEKFLKKLSIDATHIIKRNKAGVRIPRIKTIFGLAHTDDGKEPNKPTVAMFGAGPEDVEFCLNRDGATEPQAGGKKSAKQKKKQATPQGGESSNKDYKSIFDYFKDTYNIVITNTSLPVVNVGSKENPSYLPAQVCSVLPGQASHTALSPSQTQQMIRFAVRRPVENAESIVTSGLSTLGLNAVTQLLAAFGLDVNSGLVAVPGRVLTGPDIKYHQSKSISTRFGSWNMQSVRFITSTDLTDWTYLWISESGVEDYWNNDTELRSKINEFTSVLKNVGVNASNCVPGMHINVNDASAEAEIDKAFKRFSSTPNKAPPKLILVVLPSTKALIYNRVKLACDVREGLVNVCVLAPKFAKANAQYHANVALKVNLKLGGRNQFLENAKLGILSEGRTMVVGIDVTHPSPGSSANAPSVAGIVASVDRWLGQWPAELKIQTARKEMVTDLSVMLESRLRHWQRKNGGFPENILVYRDGVSEGQYNLVLEQELPALRQACKKLYPATSTTKGLPRMTIIVVGKRHNTRFYPTKKEDADRSSNPQNGTVVDRGVTEARNWDFFLQAHTALQGTARPAHYYVIHDEIFRGSKVPAPFQNSADVLQDLTHNLCYMFGRATKAVSICPPAYYADLVCERARCYLSKEFAPPSNQSTVASTAGQAAAARNVSIHANVKDSMFYI